VKALRFLLHTFAYLYHFLLAAFLAGISLVAMLASENNFELGMIPWWTGKTLARALFGANLAGLIAVIMAVRGRMRPLLALWALIVFGVMVYGFFISGYRYADAEHFQQALLLVGGALLALIGSRSQVTHR
jgi:hypothetical protein